MIEDPTVQHEGDDPDGTGRRCPRCREPVAADPVGALAWTYGRCYCARFPGEHVTEQVWHRACLAMTTVEAWSVGRVD